MLRAKHRSTARPPRKLRDITNRAVHSVLENLESRRMLSAGSLDSSFNSIGYVQDTLGPNFGANINSVAIDPSSGDIIAAGVADGHVTIARYHSDGTPDTSFAGDGNVTNSVDGHSGVISAVIGDDDSVQSVVVRPDGEIVVSGHVTVTVGDSQRSDLFAMALLSDGSVDTSFDSTAATPGVDVIDSGVPDADLTPADLVVDSSNNVYLVGYGSDMADIIKITPTGPDNSFGTDGLLQVSIGSNATATSATLQSNNDLIIAGGNSSGGFIERVDLATQSLDTTFGPDNDGVVTVSSTDGFVDIAQDPNGNLLAAGSTSINNGGDFNETATQIFRYDANGNLDTTYGTNGIATIEAGTPEQGYIAKAYIPFALTVDSQSRVIVTGTIRDETGNSGEVDSVMTARLTSTGQLDNTFANGGIATTTITGSSDIGQSIALQSDGKIVVAGSAQGTDFLTLRYIAAIPAPSVSLATYSYATSPNTLSFTFNEGVTTSLAAISIKRTSDNLVISPAGFSYNALGHVANFTFNGPIPNGNYIVTLAANGVTNSDNAHMSANYVFNFFALAGDANHDGVVNVTDLFALAKNWQTSGKNYTQGDFNYDGIVNLLDLKILAANWGNTSSGASLGPLLGPMPAILPLASSPIVATLSTTTNKRTATPSLISLILT